MAQPDGGPAIAELAMDIFRHCRSPETGRKIEAMNLAAVSRASSVEATSLAWWWHERRRWDASSLGSADGDGECSLPISLAVGSDHLSTPRSGTRARKVPRLETPWLPIC